MTSAAWALQTAIRTALLGDSSLAALIGSPPRVYDRVPDGTALPYAVFGEWSVTQNDTDDSRIDSHVIEIEIWSAYAGAKEAKSVAVVVEAALHGAQLTLEDHVLIDLAYTGCAFDDDPKDGVARCVIRFRALTEANG
jgi:Protein of unknown function (DUF3168)